MIAPKKTPPSKHKSVGSRYDGKFFRSRAERERYKVLRHRQREGIISGVTCQPRFKIVHPVTREYICTYVGDFEYFVADTGEIVIEDVKGQVLETYKLKKKMMRVLLGIDITEVRLKRAKYTEDGEHMIRGAWYVGELPEGEVR